MSSLSSQDITKRSFKKLISSFLVLGIFVMQSFISLVPFVGAGFADASTIDVWWPTEEARISGTQPFKALLQGYSVEDYKMYWNVDGGSQNIMDTSYADWPHKETLVNVSEWNWNGEGPYVVGFTAFSNSGKKLSEHFVPVFMDNYNSLEPVAEEVEPIQLQAPESDSDTILSDSINIWWPTDSVEVSGTQPLKALVENKEISEYDMYWKAEGGDSNKMDDSWQDWPHKESLIDMSLWTWLGRGPYSIELEAYAKNSTNLIARRNVSVYVTQLQGDSQPKTKEQKKNHQQEPENPSKAEPSVNTSIDGSLYVDYYSPAKSYAEQIRSYDPYRASLMDKIASQSTARWFGGWNADVYSDAKSLVDAASSQGAIASLVAYNIPQRDCGSYSAGGAGSPEHYKQWISSFASGIGNRRAIVILEPDSIPGMECLSEHDKNVRMSLLGYAVDVLKSNTQASVYIDAGHANWLAPEIVAERLRRSGIEKADGFSLNVSNYVTTEDNANYGRVVSSMVGGKHFVIDTSRNGLGPNGSEWCNPEGRALGFPPTTHTGDSLIDAYLWIKVPGESDGTCNGGPSAGVFWPEYAIGLAERAQW